MNLKRSVEAIEDHFFEILGFQGIDELSSFSSVSTGELKRLINGCHQDAIPDDLAIKLATSVHDRHFDKGWTFQRSICCFVEALTYLLNNKKALFDMVSPDARELVPELRQILLQFRVSSAAIHELKSRKIVWHKQCILEIITQRQNLYSHRIELNKNRQCKATYKEIYYYLISVIDDWELPHDYDEYGKLQEFVSGDIETIESFFSMGIENNRYDEVFAVFKGLRNILHLTENRELYLEVAKWLLEGARSRQKIEEELLSLTSLLWTYCSRPEMLSKANDLFPSVWKLLDRPGVLQHLDQDVVAMLCELKLRIPVRIHRNVSNLSSDRFLRLKNEALEVLYRLQRKTLVERREIARYRICILYQEAIFQYLNGKYSCSYELFERIRKVATEIGWQRIKNASISWLGTLAMVRQNGALCDELLNQIKETDCSPKRFETCKLLSFCNSRHHCNPSSVDVVFKTAYPIDRIWIYGMDSS